MKQPDISDLLDSDQMRGLIGDCRAAMAMSGQPTGLCGQSWIDTGNPNREQCDICNGTGGIASASRCPECEK